MTRQHRELLDRGCSCHTMPPCSFCTSLTEEEAGIFANYGLDALGEHWRFVDELNERRRINRYVKNLMIIDRERFDSQTGAPWDNMLTGAVARMDIVLIESPDSYEVLKNRYGPDYYKFCKQALPQFLMNPTERYL